MKLSHLAIACLLLCHCAHRQPLPKGVAWDEKSATFHWWRGEVTFPRGFVYETGGCGDTFCGHFSSPDGKIVIHHDIGGYAGGWARNKKQPFEESIVGTARVWVGHGDWHKGPGDKGPGELTTMWAVTFPDNGCANFYLISSDPREGELIAQLARTFRPTGTKHFDSPMCDRSR